MLPASASESSAVRRGFEDGLGRRYRPAARSDSETPLEILCFRHEITDVPAFDFALRERVARLSDLQHPSFARIRKVDRLNDERGTVVLMSDGVSGDRLIDILTDVERTGRVLDLNAALQLVRELLSAIKILHQPARVAHGAIALERLFVTPGGRLVIAEYGLGAALEQLKYSRERYWKELRVALPMNVGLSRFDERADLTQIGVVALSLILGRPLKDNEYPKEIEELVSASCRRIDGVQEPSFSGLRDWLRRILQLEVRNAFRSVSEAETAFAELLSGNSKYNAEPRSVETFMQRYHGAIPQAPAPPPVEPDPAPDSSMEIEPIEIRPLTSHDEPYEPLPSPEMDSADMSGEGSHELDEEDAMKSSHSGTRRASRLKWMVAGVAVLAVTTAGVFAARQRFSPAVAPVTTGTVTVNTDPPGAEVQIDGTARGRSPLTLSLAAGAHTLVVRGTGEPRTIPITITAGAEVSQYLELPKAGSGFGQLQVRSEPAGARISIDGTPVGKTPLTIVEIAPGEHAITLESELGSVTQKVTIEAGVPASLMVPMVAQAGTASTGWVSISAPLVVDLRENGRLLGNSGIDRIMLPSGKHELELVNEVIGYRELRTVVVSPGRVAAIGVTLPKGTISLNAIPWASVTIDGESVGDTPIGNLQLPVGQHEVVFRNSELGEQRRVITVTSHTPVRLSVDLTRK
jgi:serine/threonine protein kinase